MILHTYENLKVFKEVCTIYLGSKQWNIKNSLTLTHSPYTYKKF
jgi:hypothetical protein